MIRAAIIPYAAGYASIVVAEGTEAPLRLVHASSHQVGRLVPIENPRPGKDKRRELDAAAEAERLVLLAQEHGAECVVLPRSRTGINRDIGAHITELVASVGGAVEEADSRCVVSYGAQFDDWPEATTAGIDKAAGLLLDGRARAARSPVATVQPPDRSAPPLPTTPEAQPSPPDSAPRVETEGPLDPIADGAVVAGIDPGSAHIGVAVARAGERRLLRMQRFDLRGKFTDDNIEDVAIAVATALLRDGVRVAVLETVEWARIPMAESASSIASQIMRAERVGQAIAMLLRWKDVEVRRVTAQRWRAAVVGKGGAKDDEITAPVAACFDNFPDISDAHSRDAAGVLAWAMMPAEPVKARAPRKPGAPKRRRRKDEDAREAAGCTCAGKHWAWCPLFVKGVRA